MSLVLAAIALMVAPGARIARLRLTGLTARPKRQREPRKRAKPVDPLCLAAGWDLLAACLRAGLPVSDAVRAVAGRIPGEGGQALRMTAGLLALGADATAAWQPVANVPETAALARGARRTARSGTELATVAAALATEVRVAAGDECEVRAQRAGVLIAGPLGLCFLPAFVCLGIVPVLVGLAGSLGLTR
ncbi:pilus assembly protein TadC [Kibdelosporangium banguiense]|uniref:Pilus assembly protein TadC n=1 Tax=Kibdelosporangium banguiense TaxID=1365924 RepID=A0ABS4TBS1_9PSEU|nr:type II secretion system F family protein [Kibdelosporangium banguiense]MBP2321429.1 pilus assembly protein TadC [Kibdelosporangium banguiense]